jgi:hypothetical protein
MGTCKILLKTGNVPLDCLFECKRGCHEDDPPTRDGVACNRCDEEGLHWLPIVKPDGRTTYALHGEQNRRHVCTPNSDDFGVVPSE